MKPVLVLLPVLGLTWLVGVLVHLSPAWAYAAVGLNSFQVLLGPGPPGTRALTQSGAQREGLACQQMGKGVSCRSWEAPTATWGHCQEAGS